MVAAAVVRSCDRLARRAPEDELQVVPGGLAHQDEPAMLAGEGGKVEGAELSRATLLPLVGLHQIHPHPKSPKLPPAKKY